MCGLAEEADREARYSHTTSQAGRGSERWKGPARWEEAC